MLPTITAVGTLNRLETTVTTSGKEVTRFTLECSEKNSKGEWENLYLKGEVWENSSKFLNQYFSNGSVAIVTGKLVTNVYEKNGTKVYENKLLFPSVSFVPKSKSNSQEQGQQHQQSYVPDVDVDEENLPF